MHIHYDVTASGSMLPFGDTVVTAVLGYAVVFMGLMLLMAIVCLMGMVFKAKARKTAAPAVVSLPENTVIPQTQAPAAPGSAGEIKCFDVPDKEAAMIMAIVADQMGKPLNELRFKSIKEVK